MIDSLRKVGEKIGGAVKSNFDMGIEDVRNSPNNYPLNPIGFTNACATRLIYVLNYTGAPITKSSLWQTVTGSDGNNYIFRVRDIKAYLPYTFGKPDIDKGPTARPEDFVGKKGIIVFDVTFADASAHATLWNGSKAIDDHYFHPRPGASLLGVRLWICP